MIDRRPKDEEQLSIRSKKAKVIWIPLALVDLG